MPLLIEGVSCLDAWAKGVQMLTNVGCDSDYLMTTIEEPWSMDPVWLSEFCPRLVLPTAASLRSVVRVLAPDCLLHVGKPRGQKYAEAWEWYDRARRNHLKLSNWKSTYFERLTRLPSGSNQLETIIEKMNAWPYDRIAAFYAHTTHMDLDHLTPQGSPCLQYVQFLQRKNQPLDMVAVYRNHDFTEKVLGNYIGLGRLLKFVAVETNQTPGKLSCLSVHAYLKQKKRVLTLASQALN